ncbi:MAG: PEP-CTERM-box response regulator transcription factor [Legionellales bacterium]|nr:PEP-CTERM-box response regulator transcription factor [Legionellales bacterium]
MDKKRCLLVVDDDPGIQEQLKWCFCDSTQVLPARNRQEAIAALRRFSPPVVILDLGLPPDEAGTSQGLLLLEEILQLAPLTKVIVVTGRDGHETAVQAIGMGAYDFYAKPIDIERIRLTVDRTFHIYELENDYRSLYMPQNRSLACGIVSNHPSMEKVCRMIEKVAPTTVTTLLLGESGTGKEILAKAIHRMSPRSDGPFIAINCAAIPESLLESELFGYEKGAFTGANHTNKGRIESADGGTLFLDEVGDLPLSLQPKLLRFLQERTIERLGSTRQLNVDVRIVCATHHNLSDLIGQGAFREDLFYRLSEMSVDIPPLRLRGNDAVLLARMFLLRYAQELKRPVKGFLQEALDAIERYHWPGNVRELENVVKRAMIISEGAWVGKVDLGLNVEGEDAMPFSLREVRDNAERMSIIRALNHCSFNVSKAAELLGITRPTLYNLMEKLDIRETVGTADSEDDS